MFPAIESNKLGNAIVGKIKAKLAGSVVKRRDITEDFPHFDAVAVILRSTLMHLWSTKQTEIARFSQELISELLETNMLVIDSPMHNFGITSTLKAYFDLVFSSGQTFRMTPQGSIGLVNGKQAFIVLSSGFIFSEGVYASMDYNIGYLADILNFIGIHLGRKVWLFRVTMRSKRQLTIFR